PTSDTMYVGDKEGDKKSLNSRRIQILKEIRNNPHITQEQLVKRIGVGLTAIENNIRFLKEHGYIVRSGSKKTGHWVILTN
ncbi:MAG: winged helix-turn-helix domain-containing protein, partial [Bacillota bacterium]|nr:winged helix-turn-helix domain-containing protein [Bacillota bacterium]